MVDRRRASDIALGPGSPDRRDKRRLRDGVEGFRSLLSRRKCLTVERERVKGEKTVSPFTIPAVPQRNRCCAPRSPPGPQPAVGSTRHPCLDSPLSAIPGGQPLSSDLRFADFSGGQGIAAYHVVSETYPLLHENLPEAVLRTCPGYPICHPPTPSPKIPGRGVNAIPGYSFADGWKPVAPVSAAPPGRLAADAYRLLCKNCLTRSESGLLKNFSGGAFSINNPFSRNTTSSETWRAKSIS